MCSDSSLSRIESPRTIVKFETPRRDSPSPPVAFLATATFGFSSVGLEACWEVDAGGGETDPRPKEGVGVAVLELLGRGFFFLGDPFIAFAILAFSSFSFCCSAAFRAAGMGRERAREGESERRQSERGSWRTCDSDQSSVRYTYHLKHKSVLEMDDRHFSFVEVVRFAHCLDPSWLFFWWWMWEREKDGKRRRKSRNKIELLCRYS